MRPRIKALQLAVLTAFLFSATVTSAQYSTSTPYAPLTIANPPNGDSCANTWYDPEVFVLPNATDLGLLAQAGAPNPCQTLPYDSIYPASRNSVGAWTSPSATQCPRMKGEYVRCGWTGGSNAGPIASPSVIRLPNTSSPNGYRYFMAFSGGNADYVHGKVYWAYSDDGINWNVYTNSSLPEIWSPLLQAKYERSSSAPRSTPACSAPSGIGQLQLAYENGYVYLFSQYNHPIQPECSDPNSSACLNSPYKGYDRALSSLLTRFTYNSGHPWGFGSGWSIFHNGAWVTHSGKLVFGYDVNASGVQLPADTGNPVVGIYNSVQTAGFEFGAGDVKYGNGKWLHVWSFGGTWAQTANCLDPTVCGWGTKQQINLNNITANGYSNLVEIMPGIHYGALRKADGTYTGTHWWIWVPAPTGNKACYDGPNRNVFAGLSLIPAQLCTPDVPCGP